MKKIMKIIATVLCVTLCFGMTYAEGALSDIEMLGRLSADTNQRSASVGKITEELQDKMEDSSD